MKPSGRPKWTIEDFPERKYSVGQEVYTIEMEGSIYGMLPPRCIYIKKHTIDRMTLASLNSKYFPDKKHDLAYYVDGSSYTMVFESTSYSTYAEALVELKASIQRNYEYYQETAKEFAQIVESSHAAWITALSEKNGLL